MAIFIPKGFEVEKKTDLLFYFHGHGNHLEKSFEKFSLREQIANSGKNVILVFPQGPKDAKDSGLGKLEDPDGLKNLAEEVLDRLQADRKIKTRKLGKVVVCGHSGAFRGIAMCLKQGGLEDYITEVYLF